MIRPAVLASILAAAVGCAGTSNVATMPATTVDVGPAVRVKVTAWSRADEAAWRGRTGGRTALRSEPSPHPFVTAAITLYDRPPPARVCPRRQPPRDPLVDPGNWRYAFATPSGVVAAEVTLLSVDEMPGRAGHRSVRLVYAVTPPPGAPVLPADRGGILYVRPAEDACRRRYALGGRRVVAVRLPRAAGP